MSRARRTWCFALLLTLAAARGGRAEEPLFQQEPFDEITLSQPAGTVLKVKPLDLPDRLVPENPEPNEKLTVRLLDKPDKLFEITWSSIAKVRLFEQMLLERANQLTAAGSLDDAYEYYRYLEHNHSKLPGLAKAVEDYLYEEAKVAMRKQDYAAALAMLREIFQRNPQRPGLDVAMGAATGKLMEKHLAAGDQPAVRELLRTLGGCFPQQPAIAAWEAKLKQSGEALLDEAKAAEQQGDLRKASDLCRQVDHVWPATAGAAAWAKGLCGRYPRVVVGVAGNAAVAPGPSPTPAVGTAAWYCDWDARRRGRLFGRTICELTAPAVGGGKYVCPLGEAAVEKPGQRITIVIGSALLGEPGGAGPTAFDLVRPVATSAPPLADWLKSVTATDADRLRIELVRPSVRPEALLQVGFGAESTIGQPYRAAERSAAGVTYLANPAYFAAAGSRPQEIIESLQADPAEAVRAVRNGQADVVDRVPAALLPQLQADKRLVVRPYAAPLVHCLIPNLRRPLTADRMFRRALVYGLHREGMLQQLVGDSKLPGCRVLSGPLPLGLKPNDPLGYAYDGKIEPRPYDPELATSLATVAMRQAASATGKPADIGKPAAGEKPAPAAAAAITLVLVHPADEVAVAACQQIQSQLRLVGINLELRRDDGHALAAITAPANDRAGADLLYAELALWEPLVDARQVLGADGLAGGCSPAMSSALLRLDEARDFTRAQAALYAVHRLAFEETALVPLWQWPEYYACRADLQGVGDTILTLYQNVELWQPAFHWSSE